MFNGAILAEPNALNSVGAEHTLSDHGRLIGTRGSSCEIERDRRYIVRCLQEPTQILILRPAE